jgi:hypothetical protein
MSSILCCITGLIVCIAFKCLKEEKIHIVNEVLNNSPEHDYADVRDKLSDE